MSLLPLMLAISAVTPAAAETDSAKRIEAPPRQVVAVYFHRTERCPTCKRIGTLSQEAIAQGFPAETKKRSVELRFVDFQDKKNAALTKSYNITGPTLVLMNNYDSKTVNWKPLPLVWRYFGKPEVFYEYVQKSVREFRKLTKEEAEELARKTQEQGRE